MSFEEIYEMQRGLNTMTVGHPVDHRMPEEERVKWMLRYNLAQQQEQAELVDSLAWKWWKKGENNWENIRVELIDELHFWMSKCQIAGLTGQEVIELYKKKNALNWKRQQGGYKQGTYSKVVDGKEDNEALHRPEKP
jgi:NTP pyrophosphatase (non-canonical NTP hydrolase)